MIPLAELNFMKYVFSSPNWAGLELVPMLHMLMSRLKSEPPRLNWVPQALFIVQSPRHDTWVTRHLELSW